MTPTALTLFPEPHVEAKPLNHDQQAVMDALTLGPATAYEIQVRLANAGINRAINCIGKRLSELGPGTEANPGRSVIERTGERRPGYSPRKLDEWRIK
jgi:hypothetical protein